MGSSWFDTEVRERREHTPWATISLISFMREMVLNSPNYGDRDDASQDNSVTLTFSYRHDVSTREWWGIEWTGADEKRHSVSSQEYGLLMWRAAQKEMAIRQRIERDEKPYKHILARRILEIAETGDLEALQALAKELKGEE